MYRRKDYNSINVGSATFVRLVRELAEFKHGFRIHMNFVTIHSTLLTTSFSDLIMIQFLPALPCPGQYFANQVNFTTISMVRHFYGVAAIASCRLLRFYSYRPSATKSEIITQVQQLSILATTYASYAFNLP